LKSGELTLECTPMPPDDHPEDDLSHLCLADERKVFQGLLGMAQWIVARSSFGNVHHGYIFRHMRIWMKGGED
jgi:hypothetical protein